jgi:hypothetical protein
MMTGDAGFLDFIKEAKLHNTADADTADADKKSSAEIEQKIDVCALSEKCIVLRCKVPPSPAALGKPGGTGSSGGVGGDGGDNGVLFLRSQGDAVVLLRDHFAMARSVDGSAIIASGGAMGPGGRGGKGGHPGPSGKNDALKLCPKPYPGQAGEIGSDGPSGGVEPTTSDGRPGRAHEAIPSRLAFRDYFGRRLH